MPKPVGAGTVLTRDGRLVVKNAEYADDERPLDPDCGCPTCARHSRSYIRHLFQAGEILACTLATIHNLHFYQDLMAGIRGAIADGRFAAHHAEVGGRWAAGEEKRLADRKGA